MLAPRLVDILPERWLRCETAPRCALCGILRRHLNAEAVGVKISGTQACSKARRIDAIFGSVPNQWRKAKAPCHSSMLKP